jgi:hypothetical protein
MSGVVQLVSVGVQDTHLTGNPQISFFKSAYKRHTNFSPVTRRQLIQGNPAPGATSTVRIDRQGDLLNYMFLVATVNNTTQLIDEWSNVIQKAELLIGGQVIDTQDSLFCEEIAVDLFATNGSKSYPASLHGGLNSSSFFYPFRFFCCENWYSSLPLIALQYHDVEVRITWSDILPANYRLEFSAHYILLDDQEREWFQNTPQDMLIFQVQKSVPSNEKTQDLNFNHPVKYIASSNSDDTNSLVSLTNKIKLEANGTDITDLNISIPYYTSVPTYFHTDYSSANAENIFLYPFCLNTAKHQPSGSLNFSRLDSFKIHCTEVITKPVYAVNHNILRIKNGMGAVMYAN